MKKIYLFVAVLSLLISTGAHAQTSYTISSSQNWSAGIPSTCSACTITLSAGVTLTVDKNVTCQNCVFQGGTLSMGSQSLNIQYAGSLTTTYFKGTNLNIYGTGKVIVNAPISIGNSIFTFSNSSSFTTSYEVDMDASRVNLYDNSSMVSTGGSSTPINLFNSSQIVIGNGSKSSKASFLVSGPGLILNDKSGVAVGNENDSYTNWSSYTYSPNIHSNGNAQKTYGTTNNSFNCGTGHANSCSAPVVYGPSALSSSGAVAINILPIVIDQFSAALTGKRTVGLSWDTREETNSSHFDIEHSQDGSVWERIGTVQAQGNSSVLADYSFTDPKPATGNNYYRLNMVDLDGSSRYSETRLVRTSVMTSISFFPNPAKDYVNVSMGQLSAAQTTIRLINQAGQVLQEKTIAAGNATIVSFPVQQYRTGLYILSVSSSDGTQESNKLLISRS
jgi:hypothetical protein